MENKIIYYKEIDSTNTQIEKLAKTGAVHGTVVVAKRQTVGKGRRGRTWESPDGDNIYLSILLRPDIAVQKASMLTLVMAHSVLKAIEKQGYTGVQIKWPNDLVLSGKKICGILTEMHLKDTVIDYVVVGVGINVDVQTFPEELEDKATSLYLETGRKADSAKLVEDVLHLFHEEYEQFIKAGDLSFMQEGYNSVLINRDKEVRVLEPGNEYTAYALGINPFGELLVQKEDGETEAVFAGEVSVRGVYGYV